MELEAEPVGSIGGGALEAGALKEARQIFETRTARIMRFNLSGADAASMQMICGGHVEVLVEHIPCTATNVEVFKALQAALANGEKCYFIADLGHPEGPINGIGRCVTLEDGSIAGEFPFQAAFLDILKGRAFSSSYPVVIDLADKRFFVERCFTPSTVYIFGAGHVSQQVAILAEMAAFRVLVIDDREEFANRERFPSANEVVVLDSFDRCFSGLEIDNDSFVVIVTRGHLHDGTVLAQTLRTKARYIGMMGSKRKRHELFKTFVQDGFSEVDLQKVHCPIGLEIKAETQIEIAFSIVSQLILARAQSTEMK